MPQYDEIEIEDMTYDPETLTYSYPCPCGDRFKVSLEDLWDGEDIADCNSCTLYIQVIYEQENLPPLPDDDDSDDEDNAKESNPKAEDEKKEQEEKKEQDSTSSKTPSVETEDDTDATLGMGKLSLKSTSAMEKDPAVNIPTTAAA